jgi:hypothetical protein
MGFYTTGMMSFEVKGAQKSVINWNSSSEIIAVFLKSCIVDVDYMPPVA